MDLHKIEAELAEHARQQRSSPSPPLAVSPSDAAPLLRALIETNRRAACAVHRDPDRARPPVPIGVAIRQRLLF